jgi:microcystin-dependent protein/cytoskeletal protein CcmA (bactofilin family)
MSHLKTKRITMNRGVYYDNRLAKYTNLPMYTGNTHVEHNLSVDGNVAILGSLSIHSDLHVDGNEFLGGNLDMSGNIHVDGNEFIRGNLDVSGNQAVTGNVRVYGNEVLTGNLDVSGNQAVTGNVRVYGNEVLTGNLDVSGNVTTTQDVYSRSVYATGNYYLDNYVLIPAGTVIQSAAINVPAGWLNCDGNLISRTAYPDLFAAIEYIYGGSDASFNLPDLRGRACIGAGQGVGLTNRALGSTGGSETHTLISDEMPSHNHEITDPGHTHTWNNGLDPDDMGGGGSNAEYTRAGGSVTDAILNATTGIEVRNTGGGGAHNNMQPFLTLRFLIKY